MHCDELTDKELVDFKKQLDAALTKDKISEILERLKALEKTKEPLPPSTGCVSNCCCKCCNCCNCPNFRYPQPYPTPWYPHYQVGDFPSWSDSYGSIGSPSHFC